MLNSAFSIAVDCVRVSGRCCRVGLDWKGVGSDNNDRGLARKQYQVEKAEYRMIRRISVRASQVERWSPTGCTPGGQRPHPFRRQI